MSSTASKKTHSHRIVVAMSGGVDSSVAALLLKRQGFRVEGLFMKNWEEDDGTQYCTDLDDLRDTQEVCEQLQIPLHRVNFSADYWDEVFAQCLHQFRSGCTPNPDVLCNQRIKFQKCLDYALHELKADAFATGHYARVKKTKGQTRLLKSMDSNKDQSYFLHRVSADRLSRVVFPVGDMTKSQVRSVALEAGLKVHNKPDSTGICFIGERPFGTFLKRYIESNPGDIVDLEGRVLGRHDGLMYYTIGQRQGLAIGGVKGCQQEPWYVADKDFAQNRLLVVQGNDHHLLFSSHFKIDQVFWINPPAPELPYRGYVKCRYRQDDQACLLEFRDGDYCVNLETPQRAVTPGQFACFYEGDICLGGGVISQNT